MWAPIKTNGISLELDALKSTFILLLWHMHLYLGLHICLLCYNVSHLSTLFLYLVCDLWTRHLLGLCRSYVNGVTSRIPKIIFGGQKLIGTNSTKNSSRLTKMVSTPWIICRSLQKLSRYIFTFKLLTGKFCNIGGERITNYFVISLPEDIFNVKVVSGETYQWLIVCIWKLFETVGGPVPIPGHRQ